MASQDFLVIKRGYDFSKWLLKPTGKAELVEASEKLSL